MNIKIRSFIISITLMMLSLMPSVISPSPSGGAIYNGVNDYDPIRNLRICSCPTFIAQCYCIWER